jgi:hypothetical protein
MTIWMISGVLGFGGGAAFVWFFKEKIQALVIGGNALSARLHAKADAIAESAKR